MQVKISTLLEIIESELFASFSVTKIATEIIYTKKVLAAFELQDLGIEVEMTAESVLELLKEYNQRQCDFEITEWSQEPDPNQQLFFYADFCIDFTSGKCLFGLENYLECTMFVEVKDGIENGELWKYLQQNYEEDFYELREELREDGTLEYVRNGKNDNHKEAFQLGE